MRRFVLLLLALLLALPAAAMADDSQFVEHEPFALDDAWVEGSTRPGEYHYYPFTVEQVGLVTVRAQLFCTGRVQLLDADLIEWDEGYFNGSAAAPPRASSCRRRNVSAMRRSACAAARHSAQANNSVNSDTATIATQIRPAPFPVSRAARRAFFLFCAPGADFMRGGLTSAGKTRIMKFAADALVAQQDRAAAS